MKYKVGDLIYGSGYYRQVYKIEDKIYYCICSDKFCSSTFLMKTSISILDRCNYPLENNKKILEFLDEMKAEIL